jgi:O-antigen ligase
LRRRRIGHAAKGPLEVRGNRRANDILSSILTSRALTGRLSTILGVAACLYFSTLPITGAFVRSIAFAVAALCAIVLVVGSSFPGATRLPSPGSLVTYSVALWCAWSVASIAWSIDWRYTAGELRTEVGWGVLTMAAFYVAASDRRGWRALLITVLAIGGVMGLLALALYLPANAWNSEIMFYRFHAGVSSYSTFIVLTLPFVPLVMAPPPTGFGECRKSIASVGVLVAIAVCAARLTENRVIWIALGMMLVVSASLAARRWRGHVRAAPLRALAAVALLLLLLAWLFAGTMEERVRSDFPPRTTAWQTLANDPRLGLWRYVIGRIAERPWLGYGFGKSILGEQLRAALHDPLLSHAHNTFASQWLQTGAIGLAAFVLLLGVLVRRYVQLLRTREDGRALLGLAGLALITAFCVKGLTDDVMNRSSSKEFWALNAMLLGFGARSQGGRICAPLASADITAPANAAAEPGAATPPPLRRRPSESA